MPDQKTTNRPQSLLKRYLRYIGAFASVLAVVFLMYYFSSIVTWVILAWVISLLGSPLMDLLGRIRYRGWHLPSALRAILVLLLFYGIFSLMVYIFVPVIIKQGRQLAGVDYTSIIASLEEPINNINDWLVRRGFIEGTILEPPSPNENTAVADSITTPTLRPITTTTIAVDSILTATGEKVPTTNIQLQFSVDPTTLRALYNQDTLGRQDGGAPNAPEGVHEQIRQTLREYISPARMVTQSVVYLVGFIGNFFILITSVTFIAFFFLKDEKLFGRAIKVLVPKRRLGEMDTALAAIRRLLTRYFSGILLQITLITVYVTVLLSFFSVPNAFLIAFFAAIINVIPYLGPLIGGLFAGLVIISSNIDASFYDVTFPMLLKAVGVFASMQVLDGFILQPYIFSNSVSAHPLEIFIVVVIGAQLGGVTGMIVAIPTYTVIRVIAAVFLREFQLVQKLTHNIDYSEEDPDHLGEKVDIEVEK